MLKNKSYFSDLVKYNKDSQALFYSKLFDKLSDNFVYFLSSSILLSFFIQIFSLQRIFYTADGWSFPIISFSLALGIFLCSLCNVIIYSLKFKLFEKTSSLNYFILEPIFYVSLTTLITGIYVSNDFSQAFYNLIVDMKGVVINQVIFIIHIVYWILMFRYSLKPMMENFYKVKKIKRGFHDYPKI